jgi:hypothetical protein
MPSNNIRIAVEELLDSLSNQPPPTRCRKCCSPIIKVDATFLAAGGKMWNVTLPVCPCCYLEEATATFIPDTDC